MLMGPSPTNWLFLLYIGMVSLHSGSNLLKHTTKGFSVNHFINQLLGLALDIHREFLLAALSIILFLAGMNIRPEYSMQPRVLKFTTNNTTLPLLCAFIDDLSLMSAKVSGAQTLLSSSITALTWAGLEFRADKSCPIVIVKGRSMNTKPFSVSKASVQPEVSSPIPSNHSRPIRFLGCIIDGPISDRNSSTELTDKLLAGLSVIDKSYFTGMQKLWILHLLIPRIQWPLLIYEIPIHLALKSGQKVSTFIPK